MVSRLRLFTSLLGGGLVVFSFWAFTEYGSTRDFWPFAEVILLGVFIASMPVLYVQGRRWITIGKFRLQRWRESETTTDADIFVSKSSLDFEASALDLIYDALQGNDTYEEIHRTTFSKGAGLVVIHTGFHKSYIRITESGTLVVTGASERTQDLVATLEELCSTKLKPSVIDPFTVPSIRRAPRVILIVATAIMLLAGVSTIAGTAYPSNAYNPAERTVLVGIDARSDLDSSVSGTDASIAKAQFLIQVLDEEAVEIRWDYNTSSRIRNHSRDALAISSDARGLLLHAQKCGFSDEQKLSRMESDLVDAERAVVDAIDAKSASLSDEDPHLDRVQGRLLERGRQTDRTGTTSTSAASRALNARCST